MGNQKKPSGKIVKTISQVLRTPRILTFTIHSLIKLIFIIPKYSILKQISSTTKCGIILQKIQRQKNARKINMHTFSVKLIFKSFNQRALLSIIYMLK